MNIKNLPLHLGLGFALAISGIVSGTPQAQAQTGNQSDITGTIVTTSDMVGGFSPGGDRRLNQAFRTTAIQNAVNTAAASANQLLAQKNLPIVAIGPRTAISEIAQQNLECACTRSGNFRNCVTEIERDLVNSGANPTLARNLALSFEGLTAGGKVEAGRLVVAVRAYNALVSNSSAEFLSNPPESFRAMQSVLGILLNSALAP
ncbi:MAG: hypothetical protein U7123_13735 [Potamolinea sp.]